jgi:hypothetical protein
MTYGDSRFTFFEDFSICTNVDVSVTIPLVDGTEELFSIQTSLEFSSQTTGFGLLPTMAFLLADCNFSAVCSTVMA